MVIPILTKTLLGSDRIGDVTSTMLPIAKKALLPSFLNFGFLLFWNVGQPMAIAVSTDVIMLTCSVLTFVLNIISQSYQKKKIG